jgi:carboxypeptidase PM20D1
MIKRLLLGAAGLVLRAGRRAGGQHAAPGLAPARGAALGAAGGGRGGRARAWPRRCARAPSAACWTRPAAGGGRVRHLHALLQARYPLVHAKLKREVVGDHSLLFTWPGSDAQARPSR